MKHFFLFIIFALPLAAQAQTTGRRDATPTVGRRDSLERQARNLEIHPQPRLGGESGETALGASSAGTIREIPPSTTRGHRLLRISQAALLAGNALDAASSWGKPELNPILGPQFGVRGAGIKFGIALGAIFGQNGLVRRHPDMERPITWGNFAVGGMFAGVGVRNWRMGR